MMRFCDEHGVGLAPHGKTTMAPQLFADQLAAGAWGITAATVGQAQVMAHFGVERILIANEVLDPRAIRWLADADPEVYCLVDSVAGVEALTRATGSRCSSRSASRTAAAACATPTPRWACSRPRRARHCRAGRRRMLRGRRRGTGGPSTRCSSASRRSPSRAGSAACSPTPSCSPPAAASSSTPPPDSRGISDHVVLRSGCYVTHDDGMYEAASPLARSHAASDPLLPALELWTDVLSCPEPGRAILGVGRRDAPYDAGLPTVLRAYRGGEPVALGPATVTELNDQHAFVSATGLEVGDLVCLGISHPCGAFDRWRTVLEVDPEYTVTRAIRTFF